MDAPHARAAMLIRRPAAEVFAAFTDPAITSKFWFSDGSGVLREVGQVVNWHWSWHGLDLQARVVDIERPTRLVLDWPVSRGLRLTMTFAALADDATFVDVTQEGFAPDADGVHEAIMSTERFALVLAGAKVWLEHGLQIGLVPDRHPYATFAR